MDNMPLILLHIATILTFFLVIVLLRTKNKKSLHYSAIGLVLAVFLWCLVSLAEQYASIDFHYQGMIFTNINYSVAGFISVSIFVFGFNYAYSESRLRSKIRLIYLIPIISIVLIWTNDFHQLYFVKYSIVSSEIVRGPYLVALPFFAYIMDFLGLFFLIKFSVKNSGFFSRQSLFIIIGVVFPLFVDIAFVTKALTFPVYYEPISFSIAVIFIMISIFRFGLFSIVPIAIQTVVDHISDSYIVVNEKNEIIDFNKPFLDNFQDLAGVTRKQSIGNLLQQLDAVSTVKYDMFMASITQAVQTKKSVGFENQYISRSIEKTFTVEVTPIYSQELFKGTVILLKDITEQRKSYEMIRQTQVTLIESEHLASLGQLVGGIAHNLKTPIMSIAGGLEGLTDLIDEYDDSVGDDSITPEDHHEIAEDMRGWIGKMKEYTAYMSDIISAVKGQAVQLTSTTTDSFTLKELVKRVDILMNHELKRYCCKLDVKCAIGMDVLVKGEINSFVQVINNLIINAIQAYEGKEGIIDFKISRDDQDQQMIVFEVRDHGSGITDEIKEKLFREMITTKAKNGTGLGLYMSYSTITGRFGGKMWFESVHGMGTSFYIMIPAV